MCINLCTRCVHLSACIQITQPRARMDMHLRTATSRDTICIHMYPYVSMCQYVCILAALLADISIYWIHAGLGEGLGKGHPAAHGYSFGSLRRRGVAPVCRCKKVSGNYKSTNNNWVMNRCIYYIYIWYTHIHTLHIYILYYIIIYY